jgi:hypothetical protein
MRNVNGFAMGDKVVFSSRAATKYMHGRIATITNLHRSRVTVELDGGATGRFLKGTLRCPTSILEHLDDCAASQHAAEEIGTFPNE